MTASISQEKLTELLATVNEQRATILRLEESSAMRAFGASDAACYKWPGDTAEHKALRAAYIEGAADCGGHG